MKTLIDLLEYHSKNTPKKNAIITHNDALTYQQLSEQSSKFQNSLADFSNNSVEYLTNVIMKGTNIVGRINNNGLILIDLEFSKYFNLVIIIRIVKAIINLE